MKKNLFISKRLLFVLIVNLLLIACDSDDEGTIEAPIENFGERNLEISLEFLNGFEQESTAIFDLLSEDVIGFNRLNPTGTQEPIVFDGREAEISFLSSIFAGFDNISFAERRITVSQDGNTVFLQAIGDNWTFVPTGAPYNQVYIFRLDFNEQGEIVVIEEYLNWIVNSEVTQFPIGSCQEVLCN